MKYIVIRRGKSIYLLLLFFQVRNEQTNLNLFNILLKAHLFFSRIKEYTTW